MERKWWLVIAGCVTHAVNTGFSYFGMSAFFPSFEREFGWSRAAISGAFSLARAQSSILGPLEGYLTDRVGAQRMLFIGLVIRPARIGMGWLGDLLDKRRLMIGMLVALSFSVFLMGQTAEAAIFTPCMIVYSLAYGGLASLQEPIRADYFGTKAFATIQGMSRSVQTVGTFMGPLLAGILYDLTRNYAVKFSSGSTAGFPKPNEAY
jgi:MFS family permease